VLLYDANWLTYADSSGWFGGMPHTWSLAVEAQFYLFWAVIITFVSRHYTASGERKTAIHMLILVASLIWAGSSIWRAVLWSQDAEWLRTYLGTDTRLDGVFLGSTAALLRLRWLQQPSGTWIIRVSRPTAASIEIICLAVLLFLLATLNFGQSHFGLIGFTIASAATSVLILTSVLRPDSILAPVFSLPLLTWIGRISYSIYIWHVPAEKLVKTESLLAHGFSPLAAEATRVIVTFLLGSVSYYGIERTFLKLQNHFRLQPQDGPSPTILLKPTT
jgi:peptidoglycan/LPS O-acetylase OafA/YrhL